MKEYISAVVDVVRVSEDIVLASGDEEYTSPEPNEDSENMGI